MGAISIIGAAIATAVAGIVAMKVSQNRQRREAEKDVEKKQTEREERKAMIEKAVFEKNDAKVNEIVNGLLALAVMVFFVGCCSSKKETVRYVSSDRRIVSITNEYGVACKAVPDVVFAEMLVKLDELKEIRKEREVDKRMGK